MKLFFTGSLLVYGLEAEDFFFPERLKLWEELSAWMSHVLPGAGCLGDILFWIHLSLVKCAKDLTCATCSFQPVRILQKVQCWLKFFIFDPSTKMIFVLAFSSVKGEEGKQLFCFCEYLCVNFQRMSFYSAIKL